MLRIMANDNPRIPTFRLEGRLKGPWVHELKQCLRSMVARPEVVGLNPMKSRLMQIVLCGVVFTCVGCASEQRRFTGFLSDYSILKPHPTIQGALVYWNPGIDPKQYKAVIVEPVEVDLMNRGEENAARPKDVAAFRRFVTDELTQAISRHAAIATEPGPHVLRCRLQVANLQLTQSTNEPLHSWPRREYVLGTANIETDARDSISGDLVVAYVGARGSVELKWVSWWDSPADSWEAAKTDIRNRIVTWTDDAARHFVPELNGYHTAAGSPVQRRPSVIGGPQAID